MMSLSPEGSATCMWTSRCESDSSAAAGHLVEFHVSLCAAGATPARLVHTPQLIRVWSLASAPGFLPLPVSGSSGIYRFDSLVPPGFCPWIDLELAFVCISHSASSQRARAGCRFRAWLAVLSSPRSLLPAAGRAQWAGCDSSQEHAILSLSLPVRPRGHPVTPLPPLPLSWPVDSHTGALILTRGFAFLCFLPALR